LLLIYSLLSLLMLRPPPSSTLFPYTTLFRSLVNQDKDVVLVANSYGGVPSSEAAFGLGKAERQAQGKQGGLIHLVFLSSFVLEKDRKSTRLNSSHVKISYAVFCLKKKTI